MPREDTTRKPQNVPVKTGLEGTDRTEILSGLQEGQMIITKTILPEKPEVNNPFAGPFGKGGGKKGFGGKGGKGGFKGGK